MPAFRRLKVWVKAHALTVRMYESAASFQRRYPTLGHQLMRSAHAIPSTIADGSGRAGGAQFAESLQVAMGSARELDYFLQLAVDLGAISTKEHATLEARTEEVVRMIAGLHRTLTSQRGLRTPRKRGSQLPSEPAPPAAVLLPRLPHPKTGS